MITSKDNMILIKIIITILAGSIASASFVRNSEGLVVEQIEANCFPKDTKVNLRPRFSSKNHNDSIVIQVSKRLTHQLTSRIYAIFLQEVLGYINVKLVDQPSSHGTPSEQDRMFEALLSFLPGDQSWPTPVLNLEVWIAPDIQYTAIEMKDAGKLTDSGRFGIFMPKNLIGSPEEYPSLFPYTMFLNESEHNEIIEKFSIPHEKIAELEQYAEDKVELFIPDQCIGDQKCATVLAPHYDDTSFIIQHIEELNLRMKVLWTGVHLKPAIEDLFKYCLDENKNFLVLHWTPSEIIDSTMEFVSLTMPKCETMKSNIITGCKFEMTPLMKYYNHIFGTTNSFLEESLLKFSFSKEEFISIIQSSVAYEKEIISNSDDWRKVAGYYNKIACEWMHNNGKVYERWEPSVKGKKQKIAIGGIFPFSVNGSNYQGIAEAAKMAVMALNKNNDLLPNHELGLFKLDGQCRADAVMKSFINYYMRSEPIIGVLGPACSDTVEPIAGVSKHFKMVIISYSAEGASLSNRETYPYFFRTIGDNRQYEHVYSRLLNQLNWNRVAALTEDGQKSTEYISHMETLLKQNQIELISNRKFPRERGQAEMNRFLLDLKAKNARIIIADIDDSAAQIIMCEAYKLEMTAENGYIWFLPVWLTNIWKTSLQNNTQNTTHNKCTDAEMMRAINGHFSLSHAPFADDSDLLDYENQSVGEWKESYLQKLRAATDPSDYAGYAYDAVWVYGLALSKLSKEDPSYLSDIHSLKTTRRLMEIIRATNFKGVSGRIRFSEQGSRYTIVNILQWINGTPNIVGRFFPNISEPEHQLIGGHLALNESSIVWFTKDGKIPDDGAFACSMAVLARFLHTDCEAIHIILTTITCVVSILSLSAASFVFWKKKYDRKIDETRKHLRHFGIDLLSSSSIPLNSLDKWEIPKDRVVINRRLGEGAFGTVYGGEAQIDGPESGWTAVAVKTLKVGSTTDDKVDFLSEAESMKRFDHKNIVKLLGVCLETEPVYTIMEFMLYGDLKTFLLARRHLVNSKQKEADDSDISPKRLTMMAIDISRAISYLAEQKYVHRDVACRNCLVNAQRVVKLGDFGMARPTFENDYYRFNRKGKLPVRWMSPESLALGLFTPASDVWSYGVLLYEIITFGSFPFQGLSNNQVLENIKAGQSLAIPTGARPQLEGLMKACWNPDYKKRPNASEICDFIANYPRLLSPCLDVPLASVQMAETDSDQFELLPGLRKRPSNVEEEPQNNSLPKSSTMNNFNVAGEHNNVQHFRGVSLNNFNVTTDTFPENISNNLCLNVYNPIEPLIQQGESDISRSSNSLMRYVPMFGFGKNKPIAVTPHQNAVVSVGIKSTSTSML